MENGLYKTEFQIAQAAGRGMLCVRDGKRSVRFRAVLKLIAEL